MLKVYLDDVREKPREFDLVCRSVTAFKRIPWPMLHEIEVLSLDHDLGKNRLTGYDLCKWLEERAYKGLAVPQKIVIHSANPVGCKNMQAAIRSIERYKENHANL